MASSERGVPKTRSAPYFSTNPRVVPWMAFGSSTSRPKTITDRSRSISWSVASRTASTYESVRSTFASRGPPLTASRGESISFITVGVMSGSPLQREGFGSGVEDVGRQLGQVRERARLGKGDRFFDFLVDFRFDLLAFASRQKFGQPFDLVVFDPRLGLLASPVAEFEIFVRT